MCLNFLSWGRHFPSRKEAKVKEFAIVRILSTFNRASRNLRKFFKKLYFHLNRASVFKGRVFRARNIRFVFLQLFQKVVCL